MAFAVVVGVMGFTGTAYAQTTPRILEQDSTLNNLIDPAGYSTAPLGALGRIDSAGSGSGTLLLIPGLGFGGDVFEPLVTALGESYTSWSVTLPGFGGTFAPASPPEGTSFGEQTWTDGALQGLSGLIEDEGLDDLVVVGHWLTGTQLAVRLAVAHPQRVRAVILIAGSARFVSTGNRPPPETLEARVAGVDRFLAPQWFRTVTRETWDDNNFLPGDYAINPIVGLRLWRQAAEPPLHVWVRYLNEFYAQDITLELTEVEAPVLLLKPGLEGAYQESGAEYLDAYLHRSWDGRPLTDAFEEVVVSGSRIVPWADRLDKVVGEMRRFLESNEPGS